MVTKVYSYYFKPDEASKEALRANSLLAHRYYCTLLEIELKYRIKYRELRAFHSPELAEAEAELAELQKKIDRKEASKDDISRAKVRRAEYRELRKAFDESLAPANAELANRSGKPSREERAGKSMSEIRAMMLPPRIAEKRNAEALESMLQEDSWPVAWREIAASDRDRKLELKKARSECGVSMGTYISTEQAVQTALKTSDTDPRFPRWGNGAGARKVGAQIRDGRGVTIGIGERRHPGSKGRRAIARIAYISVNIGAGVSINGTATFHRPLPSDAAISWVYFVPTRKGWEIQLTIKTNEKREAPEHASGTATITLLREKTESGLVVARIDSASGTETVTLPPELTRAIGEYPESLRSVRDIIFNSARSEWLRIFQGADNLPQWQRDMCVSTKRKSAEDPEDRFVHPSKWRGTWKLRMIADEWAKRVGVDDIVLTWKKWKTERKRRGRDLYDDSANTIRWAKRAGATDEFAVAFWLWCWARKDEHLINIERGVRERGLRRRRDIYRKLASDLRNRFVAIEVVKTSLASEMKRPKRGEEIPEEREGDVRNLRFAAGHELLLAQKNVFGDRLSVTNKAATSR